jgi:hypothetical protein
MTKCRIVASRHVPFAPNTQTIQKGYKTFFADTTCGNQRINHNKSAHSTKWSTKKKTIRGRWGPVVQHAKTSPRYLPT